jgi:PAS domain S-box-containing protein
MISKKTSMGVFTTDADLIVRSWDARLADLTGISAEEARGKRLFDIIPDLEERGLLARFQKVVGEGAVEILSASFHNYLICCPPRLPSKRFDRMQQRVIISPLRADERVTGSIVTIEDVTERLDSERDLSEQMASPDEATRLRAAAALAGEGSPSAKQALLAAIGDDSWRVRRVAVEGLAGKIGEEMVSDLLRALRHEHKDPSVLNSALQLLALSQIDVIGPLSEFLNDPDTDLRVYAALALGEVHDERAVPPLILALKDRDTNVRYHAIDSLGRLRASQSVEPLLGIAEERDFFLSFAAIDALARIGDSAASARIAPLLEDEMLRAAAASALGALGDEEALAPLAALLSESPAQAIAAAEAVASIYDRYETGFGEGSIIADQFRRLIDEAGAQNLIASLDHAREQELRSIVVTLGWLEGPAVERALAQLLGRKAARREVVEALVRYGHRVTGLILQQLKADDADTRKAAIKALGRLCDPAALPALIELLDEQPELVIAAAGALACIGDRRAFEPLLSLLDHPDAAVRQSAIGALNSLGHPEMAARARALLADPDPRLRESAVKIAGYFGFDQCLDLLLERCQDEVEQVRQAAIEQMAYLEDPRAFDVLAEAAGHTSPRMRAAAARALWLVEPAKAAPLLIPALSDSDPWVRYFAARSLGRINCHEAMETLGKMASQDEASQARIAAMEALGQTGGVRAISILAAIVEDPDIDIARAALSALGAMGHPDALPPLASALRSADASRRIAAIHALGKRGDSKAADALQWVAASDQDEAIIEAALSALARLATPESIAALVALTSDPARRKASIERLAHLGIKHIEEVARGFEHPGKEVRASAVEALARMKHPLASEQIARALDDQSATVRMAAAIALGHLGSRSAERKLAALARTDPEVRVRQAAQKALRR